MHELVLSPSEKTILAVDIGSNAMRASMACLDQTNDLEILSTMRFSLRLGEDVFRTKKISKKKIQKTIEAFEDLRDLNKKFKFKKVKIVATSAIRNAENGPLLVEKVKKETGLDIEIISGKKEAEYIQLAVANVMNLSQSRTLLIDIGGGSTEITLCDNNKIVFTKSYSCGTVRLLESGHFKKQKELIKDFVDEASSDFKIYLKKKPIDLCIGTGGNLRRMGKLRKIFFKRSNLKVTHTELSAILDEIQSFSIEQRMDYLDMREDRADVIIPATKIIEEILFQFGISEIHLPKVGLKEGLILSSLDKKPRNLFFS
ncbi:MAG: hypothetical protein VYA54_06845 [Bdellovibrionota bacterium]|nr:hypothetical protein [Bdellovibrionota bacterium]